MTVDAPAAGGVGEHSLAARLTGSPDWLARRRQAAWDAYTTMPMPSSSADEDWRRTDVSRLHPEEFVCDPDGSVSVEGLLDAMRALRDRLAADAALAVETRGGLRLLEGTDALTAQGVTVISLEDAAVSHEAEVQRALDLLGAGRSRFTAMWEALWRGGVFVHVPRGVDAAVPVVAGHTAAAERSAVFPATVVVLEERASLTLIDVMTSPASDVPMLSDAVGLAVVERGARLDHHILQRWGVGTWHIALHRARLAADAHLRLFGATLGSRLQKAYWEALLEGAGAEADIAGVCFGAGSQHLDHQSLQAHRAPDTRSDLLLKVAVRDTARSVYSGLIDVDREAQRTDGYVQNRNLILSRGAKADSIPRLQIRADDVRCSHGATAGHIDDDQRFYTHTRGVPPDEADRLIVRGFMQDALDRCPHRGVADTVGALLDEVVAGGSAAGIGAAGVDPPGATGDATS